MIGRGLWIWIGLATLCWVAAIYGFGTRYFGRDSTQQWIDRFLDKHPRLWKRVNRWHGHLRASFHYIEFSGLTLLLFLFINAFSGQSYLLAAYLAWGLASLYAWFDEWHQSRTPGRQFRRIDFLHSLCGSALTFLIILLVHEWRAL